MKLSAHKLVKNFLFFCSSSGQDDEDELSKVLAWASLAAFYYYKFGCHLAPKGIKIKVFSIVAEKSSKLQGIVMVVKPTLIQMTKKEHKLKQISHILLCRKCTILSFKIYYGCDPCCSAQFSCPTQTIWPL